ncbi:hypothetical protein CRUP_031482 [Coryphaenoides rupestris]|nr:hypothetical protein CRUP_031482 [Coryphaenoides rupestris]
MSSTGFDSSNGTGQTYANGPSQNPRMGYNMASQAPYNPMQAKGPVAPGAGLYNPGPYQPGPPAGPYQPGPPAGPYHPTPPVSSYHALPGQPQLTRPPMGGPPPPLTPPQSSSPAPRMLPAQATPPPPAATAHNYYPNQQPSPSPAWLYGAAPPPVSGVQAPMRATPPGPVGNHIGPMNPNPAATLPPPQPSPASLAGYALTPLAPVPHSAVAASRPPPAPLHGYTQPDSQHLILFEPYQSGRAPYGAPPTGHAMPPMGPPPMGSATPPPPQADAQCEGSAAGAEPHTEQGDIECPGPAAGNGLQAPYGFNHVENKPAGPPQPGPPGRHLGHYPSLPPGYQNTSAAPGTVPPMHPPMQTAPSQYPPQPQLYQQPSGGLGVAQMSSSLASLSLQGSTPEALRVVNLLQERNLLPAGPIVPPTPPLPQDLQKVNCNPEVFRCTLSSIPQTQNLLNKAKLPLGLLLHPFKDLSQLPVVTSSTIVRCRSCRTYINPFVSFLDQRRWKCNLCYRVNDVPEEFMYNPISRSYGEPQKRPEVQNATIEFIAPSEYMLRPPQPAVYLFILDVSHNAVETGYLNVVCQSLLDNISALPGDTRTKVGFITFDSTIHFYNLQEGLSQPQMLIVSDIEDIFLPTPDSLLVNLNECKELVQDLLKSLPHIFEKTMETQSALGPALQAAFKLLSPTGGRVSVFQTQLPNLGVGALKSREDPNQRASAKDIQHLAPATDFYKKLALDCSGQQVAVDLFLLSAQYCDLASLGSVYYYPSYHHQHNPCQVERFQKDLKRYLTRKIGFEAVMRIRCTKGFAVQMSIEENLVDMQVVSFQAALLYTSSKAVDRSVSASLGDARDAMTNAAIDSLASFRQGVLTIQQPGLLAPACLRLFPLYVLALLKQKAFRTGTSTRLDDRVFSMCQLKFQPLVYAMLMVHPTLYRVDDLTDQGALNISERTIPQPRELQLSVEKLCKDGAFLMDAGSLPELDTAESQRTRAFIGWLREQRPFYPSLHIIRDDSQQKGDFMQNMIEDRTESALSYYEFLLHIQQQISK